MLEKEISPKITQWLIIFLFGFIALFLWYRLASWVESRSRESTQCLIDMPETRSIDELLFRTEYCESLKAPEFFYWITLPVVNPNNL